MPSFEQEEYVPEHDEHGVLLLRPEHETVPEDSLHEELIDMILAGLKAHFEDDPMVAVHGRLAWFPTRDNTRVRVDPDVFVCMGRPAQHRSSFKAWAEEGVPPTVIIEVMSPGDRERDYIRRLQVAHDFGVQEVVLVSPFAAGGALIRQLVRGDEGWVNSKLSGSPDAPLHVESLGVTFVGGAQIQVSDQHGVWQTPAEAMTSAREADARAEQADARAQQADARALALSDKLRELGIDPDQV